MSFGYTLFLAGGDLVAAAFLGDAVIPGALDVHVGPDPLRALEAILTDRPVADIPDLTEEPVVEADTFEEIITRLPVTLVDSLIGVGDEALPGVAEEWYDSDEAVSEGWAFEDTETDLGKLRDYARQGRRTFQNLYLRITV